MEEDKEKEVRLTPPSKDSLKIGSQERVEDHPYFQQRKRLIIYLSDNRDKTEKDFYIDDDTTTF